MRGSFHLFWFNQLNLHLDLDPKEAGQPLLKYRPELDSKQVIDLKELVRKRQAIRMAVDILVVAARILELVVLEMVVLELVADIQVAVACSRLVALAA